MSGHWHYLRWETGKLGLSETGTSKLRFPGMSLEHAIEAFTKRAYGRELTFEHA